MRETYRNMNEKITPTPNLGQRVMEQAVPRNGIRIGALAMASILVIVLVALPLAAYAEEIIPMVEEFFGTITGKYTVDGVVTIVEGTNFAAGEMQLGAQPDWLVTEEGRVYFRANGENIDITDRISTEVPFTYVYTDRKVTHFMAVGRTSDNDLGWLAVRRAGSAETGDLRWLSGGYAHGYWNNAEDEPYGWYMAAYEEMGIKDSNHLRGYYD